MTPTISTLLPYVTLASHIALAVLVLAVIFRATWGKQIFGWLGKYAVHLGFLSALAAVVGSLYYSEVIGFEPCTLCWWIRIALYPLVAIFGVALWRKERGWAPFAYALPLIILALLVSLYFSYFSVGGVSLFPCTIEGAGCDRIFVKEFGYITIPMMSFTLSVYLLLLAWVSKCQSTNDSNSTNSNE